MLKYDNLITCQVGICIKKNSKIKYEKCLVFVNATKKKFLYLNHFK